MERTSGEDVNWEPAVADARVARATARIADRVMVFHVFDSLDIEPPTREETVVCGVRRSNDTMIGNALLVVTGNDACITKRRTCSRLAGRDCLHATRLPQQSAADRRWRCGDDGQPRHDTTFI